jgi:hypothetical protein
MRTVPRSSKPTAAGVPGLCAPVDREPAGAQRGVAGTPVWAARARRRGWLARRLGVRRREAWGAPARRRPTRRSMRDAVTLWAQASWMRALSEGRARDR